MKTKFDFDLDKYSELLKAVGSLSPLFSENADNIYFVSRFIEKLYVYSSGAEDISRKDNSFDALIRSSKKGVGVKTFGVANVKSEKSEKIAELTAHASSGEFKNLSHENLIQKVAAIRNNKIISDSNEYGIDLSNSIYHCLIRTQSVALVHEEKYSLIDISKIHPTNKSGKKIDNYIESTFPYFTDGVNFYTFNTSKNTLFKRFEIANGINSPLIELETVENIFEEIILWAKSKKKSHEPLMVESFKSFLILNKPVRDFVVLPLYSTRSKDKVVAEKSGINQWNAAGRTRKFGEAYIPVPSHIHVDHPKFFPQRDKTFDLDLPNGKTVNASICQDGNKALMSNPNDELCDWLFKTIDSNYGETSKARRLKNHTPYTYDDLKKIGKDSVRVSKNSNSSYEIEFMPIDSYEKFKVGESLNKDEDS